MLGSSELKPYPVRALVVESLLLLENHKYCSIRIILVPFEAFVEVVDKRAIGYRSSELSSCAL